MAVQLNKGLLLLASLCALTPFFSCAPGPPSDEALITSAKEVVASHEREWERLGRRITDSLVHVHRRLPQRYQEDHQVSFLYVRNLMPWSS